MPQRLIDITNKGTEQVNPEVGYDAHQVQFDGQTYQFSVNPNDKRVLPNGVAVRENLKVDDTTSTIKTPDTNAQRS
jgi:hypothetical protein